MLIRMIILAAALPLLHGCSQACGLVGCGPQLAFTSTLATAPAPGSTIEVCLDGDCATGVFHASETPSDAGDVGLNADFPRPAQPGELQAAFILAFTGGKDLQVQFNAADPSKLRDGDLFVVTLIDAAGMRTEVFHKTATYTVSYPNGKGCDSGCRSARFE